jgi:hypothetical protein
VCFKCYSENGVDLKHLLKRGALVAAANWPVIAIQFVAETTFQVLLAVPIVGAAILVAILLGADLVDILQGGLRGMFRTVASALLSEPVALVSFVTAFALVLFGGSALMFVVKGGTVDVLLAANGAAGRIEREPLTLETLRNASMFSLQRFMAGCARLARSYLLLGLGLMMIYGLSLTAYLVFLAYGYRAVAGYGRWLDWAIIAAPAILLVAWVTVVNFLYLLTQLAVAVDRVGLADGFRHVAQFIRTEFRAVASVFLVVAGLVVATTLVSALAWSGVGLIAFVPLVGLAVFPLQILAFILRGLVFEYLGLTALGAYLTMYVAHRTSSHAPMPTGASPVSARA